MDQRILPSQIERVMHIERSTLNKSARTVDLVISTSEPLSGPFGSEVLKHDAESITLPPHGQGLPLIVGHELKSLPVGRVDNLQIRNEQMVGTARFGRSSMAERALDDIEDQILTDVSVGARVNSWNSIDGVDYAEQWEPVEVSLVARGLDPQAKILRSETMADQLTPKPQDERRRKNEINEIFKGLDDGYHDLHIQALTSDDSPDVIRSQVLRQMKESAPRAIQSAATPDVVNRMEAGSDSIDKFKEGVAAVIELKFHQGKHDLEENKKLVERARKSEWFGAPMSLMARDWLRMTGHNLVGLSQEQIADRAWVARADGIISHSPSDFANLTLDAANKVLQRSYELAPSTFQDWTTVGSQPDFKVAHIINTSGFSDMDEVVNDGEYNYGTMSDKQETAQLRTFGKLFSQGRKLIINDDLSGMSRVTSAMGAAMRRKINRDVYDVLVTNAAMTEDAVALFNEAGHNNDPATGAAPSVATLDEARLRLRTVQAPAPATGETADILNLQPSTIIVPAALESEVEALLAAVVNPAEGTTTSFVQPNIHRGRYNIVVEPYLDTLAAPNPTRWYMVSNQIEGMIVHYLNGVQSPTLEQQEAFTRDGLTFKMRHDYDPAVADWRPFFRNDGA